MKIEPWSPVGSPFVLLRLVAAAEDSEITGNEEYYSEGDNQWNQDDYEKRHNLGRSFASLTIGIQGTKAAQRAGFGPLE